MAQSWITADRYLATQQKKAMQRRGYKAFIVRRKGMVGGKLKSIYVVSWY